MRELNEYKAEIFRRSQNRINKKERIKKRAITTAATLCLFFVVCIPCVMLVDRAPAGSAHQTTKLPVLDGLSENILGGIEQLEPQMGKLEDFDFSITYELGEKLFYDSQSGTLIKTSEDGIEQKITYHLTENEKKAVYQAIGALDIRSYPDVYDPENSKTEEGTGICITLSVKTSTFEKSVTVSDVSPNYEIKEKEARNFFRVCNTIKKLLQDTDR